MITKTMALVGMGPSAAAVLSAFCRAVIHSDDANWQLTIIDPEGGKCGGPAFGHENSGNVEYLCNMPARHMSVTEDPFDCIHWMIRNGHMKSHASADDFFANRDTFGSYLSDGIQSDIKLLQQRGVDVQVIDAEVVSVRSSDAIRLQLSLSNRQIIHSQYVVLATGGFAANSYGHLRDSPQAISHLYPFGQLAQIPKTARILMVGNSLSFIDGVTTLDAFGHTGQILTTSTTGTFPAVRARYNPNHRLAHCTSKQLRDHCNRWNVPLTVETLLHAFETECRLAGIPLKDIAFLNENVYRDQKSLVHRLTEQIRRSEFHDTRFSVLSAVCEELPEIWQAMPEVEREHFTSNLATSFAAAAFPCPPQNGAKLKNWFESGRIEFRGTVARADSESPAIQQADQGFQVQYTDGSVDRADWFVNATGLSYDLTSDVAPPLYRQLVNDGLLFANGTAGAMVNFDTCAALDGAGCPQKGLYVVGPLTKGVHFYTNSVRMNARSANKAIQSIFGHETEFYSVAAK